MKKLISISWILISSGLGIAVVFQNCAGAKFVTSESLSDGNEVLNQCTTPQCLQIQSGRAPCLFNGSEIPHGATLTAYAESTVLLATDCRSEQRQCINGVLSGSFPAAECRVSSQRACRFNGVDIPSGESVTAFLASSVPMGQTCQSEARTCQDGNLSGSFSFASCSVQAEQACIFQGLTVPSGTGVIAFQNDSVPASQQCKSEFRLCQNGVMTGAYAFASCRVAEPAGCSFNGVDIPHSGSVSAFLSSSVPFGQSCQTEVRRCDNGRLSGSYNFSSCNIDAPRACRFNGRDVAHGEKLIAYLNSAVAFGAQCEQQERVCSNGVLSGAYTFASCQVAAPRACEFNGQTIAHGSEVTAYLTSNVTSPQACQSQRRLCQNGALGGTFTFASCTVNQPVSCQFNGQTIASGQSVRAFFQSSVPFGGSCNSENRFCSNGQLSGTATFPSCQVGAPAACRLGDRTINHGQSILTYAQATVPFGASCQAVTRFCNNGQLSGSGNFITCQPQAPAACNFNGQTVAHSASVIAYAAAVVTGTQQCVSETRTCFNGALSGSFVHPRCDKKTEDLTFTPPKAACGGAGCWGDHINHGPHLNKDAIAANAARLCVERGFPTYVSHRWNRGLNSSNGNGFGVISGDVYNGSAYGGGGAVFMGGRWCRWNGSSWGSCDNRCDGCIGFFDSITCRR